MENCSLSAFADLAASRREWIAEVLQPWCRRAGLADLKQAEQEWADIAGRVDAEATLWTWAWSRFPVLVHEGLSGIDEAHEVLLTLDDETTVRGYPDSRRSLRGELVLLGFPAETPDRAIEQGPYSIDQVIDVRRT